LLVFFSSSLHDALLISPLDLVLNVSSYQGSTALLFTHSTGTPRATTIFQENFDSTTPDTLPPFWLTQHVGGNNTVPWTTSNTFRSEEHTSELQSPDHLV